MAKKKRGEGQTALVTGASAGIGVDLAECFAKDGYDLILAARSAGPLGEVAQRLASTYGVKATPIAVDLGTHGGGVKLAQEIAAKGLSVEVLVNNAGVDKPRKLLEALPEDIDLLVDVNIRAVLHLCRLIVPGMVARDRGHVVNISSVAGLVGSPGLGAYDASKAGLELLSEAQYRALQQLGEFDLKTSSWIATPDDVRSLGGALFCDRRYGRVFVYHNGAQSYYAARGFRALLRV